MVAPPAKSPCTCSERPKICRYFTLPDRNSVLANRRQPNSLVGWSVFERVCGASFLRAFTFFWTKAGNPECTLPWPCRPKEHAAHSGNLKILPLTPLPSLNQGKGPTQGGLSLHKHKNTKRPTRTPTPTLALALTLTLSRTASCERLNRAGGTSGRTRCDTWPAYSTP